MSYLPIVSPTSSLAHPSISYIVPWECAHLQKELYLQLLQYVIEKNSELLKRSVSAEMWFWRIFDRGGQTLQNWIKVGFCPVIVTALMISVGGIERLICNEEANFSRGKSQSLFNFGIMFVWKWSKCIVLPFADAKYSKVSNYSSIFPFLTIMKGQGSFSPNTISQIGNPRFRAN
jgi:hypothetical protein